MQGVSWETRLWAIAAVGWSVGFGLLFSKTFPWPVVVGVGALLAGQTFVSAWLHARTKAAEKPVSLDQGGVLVDFTQLERLLLVQAPELMPAWRALAEIYRVATPMMEGQSNDRQGLREIFDRLIPETMGHYLSLPKELRLHGKLNGGRTALESTLAQLRLLRDEAVVLLTKEYEKEGDKLLIQERYLRSKFPSAEESLRTHSSA